MRSCFRPSLQEYRLSIAHPEKGKSKHYTEWKAEQEGKTDLSQHGREADVDEAILKSRTEKQSFSII